MIEENLKNDFWEIFHTIKSRLEKLTAPVVHAEGLTQLQIYILLAIKRGEITSVGDLSRIANINQGNASTICKRLEKSGFVHRERNREDERVVSLSITDKSLQSLSRIDEKIESFVRMLNEYPKEKIQAIYTGFYEFDQILKSFEKSTDQTSAAARSKGEKACQD